MQFPLKMDLDQDPRNCFLGIRNHRAANQQLISSWWFNPPIRTNIYPLKNDGWKMQFPLKMDLDQDLRNCFLGIRNHRAPNQQLHSLKLTQHLKIGRNPKRKGSSSIHFQVLLLLVSGRGFTISWWIFTQQHLQGARLTSSWVAPSCRLSWWVFSSSPVPWRKVWGYMDDDVL